MNRDESERILILAPHGRDAAVAAQILAKADLQCEIATSMDELCDAIAAGAGAVIVATEALPPRAAQRLAAVLERQPSWSELPLLIFALPGPDKVLPSFGPLDGRHFTMLDRPIGVKALISAVRTALRWRRRQYEVRGLMVALEHRIHERDKFLAILGHELRNPLGAILLASQMRDPADQRLDGEHAAVIERQSRHLTRLVDDLLDLSRVTAGKIVLQRQVLDLCDIVDQTLESLREIAPRRAVHVTWQRAECPVFVHGDPVRLEQIVSNVVSNALKYTPDGGSVTIVVERDEQEAMLRVRDTGVGIAPDRIGRIFELFTQAENAIGRAQGGMGIGLSLVRSLVELHGGTVEASSDGFGKGSEFVVRLQVVEEPPGGTARAAVHRPATLSTRRVVVIEDNSDIRSLLQLKLRRLGHDVEAVGDGERGIERIEHLSPHLAIVDIGLPGVDGYEVAQRVRQSLGNRIFLVALSGFGMPEDKKRALDAGFDEHITKPADFNDLEELLARVPDYESA